MSRSALLLGATGLVGRELLTQLLVDPAWKRIVVVARRPSGIHDPKVEEHVFPLDEMERHADVFRVDDVFCALGTTIKTAGSQAAFRVVDHDYPIRAGRLARAASASHYLLVSALGANPSSRIFYNRVKGDVERDLAALGFDSLTIVRPSLLLGPRAEVRLGERIAAMFAWLTPPKYKPIEAAAVAGAMIRAAHDAHRGVRIIESAEMRL